LVSKTIAPITIIVALFICVSVRAQQPSDDVVKVNVSLVTVNVSVTDADGRPVTGMQAEDFVVTDEGKPVRVKFFDVHGPASIVFVVDLSSSMRGERWQNLISGMKKFLTTTNAANDYTLITFGDRPSLVTLSASKDDVWQKLSALTPRGNTALYDAALMGLSSLREIPRRQKAVVLISDGEDNSSTATLSEVREQVVTHHGAFYTVGILLRRPPVGPNLPNGRRLLNELAQATGGLAQFPTAEEIVSVLERISLDLSVQYSLSYYPPENSTGWRNIRVETTRRPERLRLRYQERYLMK
jgi:Ca-activated chloride channel family protein